MPRLVNLLNNDGLLALIIPVLFNIIVDYEPTQSAAYKAGLNPELVSLISGPRLPTAAPQMGLICKLLGLIASQEAEANFVHPATPFTLLTLANETSSEDEEEDLEDFMAQTSVALAYLSNPAFQESFLQTPRSIHLFLDAFAKAAKRSDEISSAQAGDEAVDPDDAEQLKKILSIFPQALADLSAVPQFVASAPIGSPEQAVLQQWLAASSSPKLQSAACLALGNVARSDETCLAFVQQAAVHAPLAAIVADAAVVDAQLLHGAVSFLKNLAIPAANKAALGAANLLDPGALPRVWAMDAQVQVQFVAVSLARLLMISCPENVRRVCAGREEDGATTTLLQQLVAVFKRSDQEPTKTEAARAVAAVLRVLHSSPDVPSILSPSSSTTDGSTEGLLSAFYAAHDAIPEALAYLGIQKKFPVLRSELWFVLALMSRSPAGAECCTDALRQTELTRALLETVTGRDILAERQESNGTAAAAIEAAPAPAAAEVGAGDVQKIENGIGGLGLGGLEPQQIDSAKKADLGRMDRENGLVLVTELLQRCPTKLTDEDLFLEALRAGGQIITDERRTSEGTRE
ncbi:hypothetical protein PG999_005264 [Apiospora kogelbergensis]|uniref:Uncharacterized protein n=1 Tax=Apiospora kogelbergensis TaxID=1337665 RepID=A0AAW0R1P4_9PEZI